jgi:iron complex outermembrane receptor protein
MWRRKVLAMVVAAVLLALWSDGSQAQQEEEAGPPPAGAAAAMVAGDSSTAAERESPPVAEVEEVMVVTASRIEQRLHEAPAAMTVLSSEQIELLPSYDFGDLLRNVPGLNVAQMSARDVQVAGRTATSAQATSELVLVDDRTVYLDFFGFVVWDFIPTNPREIKQIEVVRGPASAVWGANALTGVIHVVTKAPKEMQGTSVSLGGGELGTLFGSFTHAGVSGRLGYKLSGGWFEQDPYERPTGLIPGTNTPYLPFENQGTEQPKGDLRFDWDLSDRSTLSVSGGWAATDGIMHSGVGPFAIDQGSSLGYGKMTWTRGSMRLNVFANLLDGEGTNLLAIGPTGQRLVLDVTSETFNVDWNDVRVLGESHLLTYGLNARTSDFDLSLAPRGDSRDETGVFLQDEMLWGDRVRLVVGARLDDIDPIGTVLSPRATLLVSPTPRHTFRAAWNRAYRAPSLVENYLEIDIVNAVFGLGDLPLFLFPSAAVGDPELDEQELTAIEGGWVWSLGSGTSLDLAVYQNDLEGAVDFFASALYSSSRPPPFWPLPPERLDEPPYAGNLPAEFSYRNVGEIRNRGVELALQRQRQPWSWFANYSWQDRPSVRGIPANEVNVPPEHRFNAGASYSAGRFFGGLSVNHAAEALWTDVLDARFHGPTDDYTMTNLTLGVRFRRDRVGVSLTGQNVFDERVQQHVFGDILSRKVTGQVRLEL